MSGREFGYKKLLQFRRQHQEICAALEDGFTEWVDMPLDLNEFNKMFFSKRSVILEYDWNKSYGAMMACGLYAALKVAKEGKSIVFCNYGQRNGFPHCRELAKAISFKSDLDNITFQYDSLPKEVDNSNEWILDASYAGLPAFLDDWSSDDWSSDPDRVFNYIRKTNGLTDFRNQKMGKGDSRTIVGWEGIDSHRRNPKFLVVWDTRAKEQMNWVLERFPDKFLVIPYTREKQMVDEWFSKNNTMVDPGFDIQLMDPSINARRALLYSATNHIYDFRKFAKVLPEVVEDNFSKEELKELL